MSDFIFDREAPDHPWRTAFDELDASTEPTHRILAANWRMDHRVSQDREGVVLARELGAVASKDAWLRARSRHFKARICRPDAEYLEPCNGNNRLPRGPALQLLHLGSLNAILRRLLKPRRYANPTEAEDVEVVKDEIEDVVGTFPEPTRMSAFSAAVDTWAEAFKDQPDKVRRIAGLLLKALGPTQPPWFAAIAEEVLEPLQKGDGQTLCNLLGLGHLYGGGWLLAWLYPDTATGPLYRPTVVEAGDSPYHHPSPPDLAHGITLPLHNGLRACTEYIHPPLAGSAATDHCTGQLIHVPPSPPMPDAKLVTLRAAQRRRWRRELPAKPLREAWLDRYPEPHTPRS